MSKLGSSLKDAIRKLSYRTSVDQLKRRGVDKVNVLGLDRVAQLIQEAVQRSLRFKLLALDRAEIATATKDEFLRLLKSNQDLERAQDELRRLKDMAEAQVDDLRRELNRQQNRLANKLEGAEALERARFAGQDAEIAGRVEDLLEVLQEAGSGDAEVRDRVLVLVMEIVAEQRRESVEARQAVRDREVIDLQRRIQKLSTALESTEHRLTEISAMKNIDDGISSVYRDVQGLESTDRAFKKKQALMGNIFAANMNLQGKRPRTRREQR